MGDFEPPANPFEGIPGLDFDKTDPFRDERDGGAGFLISEALGNEDEGEGDLGDDAGENEDDEVEDEESPALGLRFAIEPPRLPTLDSTCFGADALGAIGGCFVAGEDEDDEEYEEPGDVGRCFVAAPFVVVDGASLKLGEDPPRLRKAPPGGGGLYIDITRHQKEELTVE